MVRVGILTAQHCLFAAFPASEPMVVSRPETAFRSRFAAFALAASFVVVLGGWLLAAPPGASPDDAYHLASIWCAEGFKEDRCLEDPGAPDMSRVRIPFSTGQLLCFQHDGQKSAACAVEEQRSDFLRFTTVNSSNIRGERPTLYYRAMHQYIGESFSGTMARIRVSNLMTVALMFGLTAAIAVPNVRRAFLLASLIASVPLGLFLMTSLNTTAWGLAGLATLWANGLTAIGHPKRINRMFGALLFVAGAVLALGSRSEATVHVGVTLTLLAVLWPSFRPLAADAVSRGFTQRLLQRRSAAIAAAVLAIATSLTALVVLAPRSARLGDVVSSVLRGYGRLEARGLDSPILSIAFEVPSLWTGALGHIWGLGALDTPIPMLATLPLAGSFVALLTLGLQNASRPRAGAALLAAGALFFFPLFALLQGGRLVYEELQPRQFMALLFVLLGIALIRTPGEARFFINAGMRLVIFLAVSVGHSVALLVTMRRHITGLTEFRYVSFSSEIEWWWASAPPPNVVWAIASLAFAIALALILRLFSESASLPSEEPSRAFAG